jgi:uncharacterized protein
MMRLAEYLLRWTGDAAYADYWERNLYNGVLAQQHPQTGMVTYFLPMQAGGKKTWSTPTESFWCCVGTTVQAQTLYPDSIYYADDEGLAVAQYIPSALAWERAGVGVRVQQAFDPMPEATHQPQALVVELAVDCAGPTEFALRLRLPWWAAGPVTLTVNGQPESVTQAPGNWCTIRRTWSHDRVRIVLPKRLEACPLPDRQDLVAFMVGPVALAGLCDEERTL